MANPQQAQLLEQLHDIRLPDNVSWWPLAIGWWIAIVIFITIITLLIVRAILRHRRKRFARYALLELEEIKHSNNQDWLMESQQIMRRTSLCYFPRSQVAVMDSKHWINFLNQTGSDIWTQQSLQLLEEAVYQNPDRIEQSHKEQFLQEVSLWLQKLPQLKSLATYSQPTTTTSDGGRSHV